MAGVDPAPGRRGETRQDQDDFETGTEVLQDAATGRRPDAVSLDYLTTFSLGPVELQDTAEGVFSYVWRLRVDGNDVYLARQNDAGDGWRAESLLFTVSDGLAAIVEADLAFNQNADPVIVAERPTGSGGDPELWIRFFDPTADSGAGATVFSNFGEGRTPRVLLDDPRIAGSDVLVFYVNDTADGIRYRQQDDRYATEKTTPHSGASGTFIEEVAKDRDGRVQVVYSERDAEAGTYSLSRIISALYPVDAQDEGVGELQASSVSCGVVKVLLNAFDQPTDEGVDELQASAVAVDVVSIIRHVLTDSQDDSGFDPDTLLGYTQAGEGADQLQASSVSAQVVSIIRNVILLTEDPANFAQVLGYTDPEEGADSLEASPVSCTVVRVIIQAYNQPTDEGVDSLQASSVDCTVTAT